MKRRTLTKIWPTDCGIKMEREHGVFTSEVLLDIQITVSSSSENLNALNIELANQWQSQG
jgi:hypothetical protein